MDSQGQTFLLVADKKLFDGSGKLDSSDACVEDSLDNNVLGASHVPCATAGWSTGDTIGVAVNVEVGLVSGPPVTCNIQWGDSTSSSGTMGCSATHVYGTSGALQITAQACQGSCDSSSSLEVHLSGPSSCPSGASGPVSVVTTSSTATYFYGTGSTGTALTIPITSELYTPTGDSAACHAEFASSIDSKTGVNYGNPIDAGGLITVNEGNPAGLDSVVSQLCQAAFPMAHAHCAMPLGGAGPTFYVKWQCPAPLTASGAYDFARGLTAVAKQGIQGKYAAAGIAALKTLGKSLVDQCLDVEVGYLSESNGQTRVVPLASVSGILSAIEQFQGFQKNRGFLVLAYNLISLGMGLGPRTVFGAADAALHFLNSVLALIHDDPTQPNALKRAMSMMTTILDPNGTTDEPTVRSPGGSVVLGYDPSNGSEVWSASGIGFMIRTDGGSELFLANNSLTLNDTFSLSHVGKAGTPIPYVTDFSLGNSSTPAIASGTLQGNQTVSSPIASSSSPDGPVYNWTHSLSLEANGTLVGNAEERVTGTVWATTGPAHASVQILVNGTAEANLTTTNGTFTATVPVPPLPFEIQVQANAPGILGATFSYEVARPPGPGPSPWAGLWNFLSASRWGVPALGLWAVLVLLVAIVVAIGSGRRRPASSAPPGVSARVPQTLVAPAAPLIPTSAQIAAGIEFCSNCGLALGSPGAFCPRCHQHRS